ncbi:MAG: hypothetical protein FWG10_06600 [Eubacteriaceae bacterium]|nr:hypothetical protein [Eubacteriaceae bacterium]
MDKKRKITITLSFLITFLLTAACSAGNTITPRSVVNQEIATPAETITAFAGLLNGKDLEGLKEIVFGEEDWIFDIGDLVFESTAISIQNPDAQMEPEEIEFYASEIENLSDTAIVCVMQEDVYLNPATSQQETLTSYLDYYLISTEVNPQWQLVYVAEQAWVDQEYANSQVLYHLRENLGLARLLTPAQTMLKYASLLSARDIQGLGQIVYSDQDWIFDNESYTFESTTITVQNPDAQMEPEEIAFYESYIDDLTGTAIVCVMQEDIYSNIETNEQEEFVSYLDYYLVTTQSNPEWQLIYVTEQAGASQDKSNLLNIMHQLRKNLSLYLK